MTVRTPFVPAFFGTSLTTGRLAADWVPRLAKELQTYPEAKGPIKVLNLGKGSQNSAWGVTQIPLIVGLKPTHILFEGFAINDAITGSGINQAQHIANIVTMINGFKAGIPGVDLTIQTMNAVSAAGAALRPNLAAYYADEITTGTAETIRTLDNYGGWPHPLPTFGSYGAAVGYSDWGSTWDPLINPAPFTFTNGDLTVTGNPAFGNNSVPSINSYSAGKRAFQVTVDALGPAPTLSVGVGSMSFPAFPLNGNGAGKSARSVGYSYDGNLYSSITADSNVSRGNVGALIVGDVVQVAVDFTAQRVWFGRNGVWLNGDPVANIGGIAMGASTNWAAVLTLSAGDAVTASFTAYPGDGLHPLWTGGVDTYLYPNVITWARARMAALWP